MVLRKCISDALSVLNNPEEFMCYYETRYNHKRFKELGYMFVL